MYKNKSFTFTGIFFLVCTIGIFSNINSIFDWIFGIITAIISLYCFFGYFFIVDFSVDSFEIVKVFISEDIINKKDVIGITHTPKKIYIQTIKKNYVISKSNFSDENFDDILNELLKIKIENKI